jgi:mannose-6-phosphate isomerase-like protein (cupin superfamily)
MSSEAKREAGAAIRRSVPAQEIRFPRLFRFDEIEAMPRIAFSDGVAAGTFISRERDGARYYSQGISFHAPAAKDVVWQATSWDEAFYCIDGTIHIVVTDADDVNVEFSLEAGEYFWAPAGYKYTVKSTGVEAKMLLTTSPQMLSGWRYTGDDESYSDVLIGMRRLRSDR